MLLTRLRDDLRNSAMVAVILFYSLLIMVQGRHAYPWNLKK
jgi:hypothetical protein